VQFWYGISESDRFIVNRRDLLDISPVLTEAASAIIDVSLLLLRADLMSVCCKILYLVPVGTSIRFLKSKALFPCCSLCGKVIKFSVVYQQGVEKLNLRGFQHCR
jgi:hypothetical protein